MKFYWFTFADGFTTCVAGLDRIEKKNLVAQHGKLVNKTLA